MKVLIVNGSPVYAPNFKVASHHIAEAMQNNVPFSYEEVATAPVKSYYGFVEDGKFYEYVCRHQEKPDTMWMLRLHLVQDNVLLPDAQVYPFRVKRTGGHQHIELDNGWTRTSIIGAHIFSEVANNDAEPDNVETPKPNYSSASLCHQLWLALNGGE